MLRAMRIAAELPAPDAQLIIVTNDKLPEWHGPALGGWFDLASGVGADGRSVDVRCVR